ncbi:MAG: hypothetical protein ACYCX2_02395 [Christensenellales bacterium]
MMKRKSFILIIALFVIMASLQSCTQSKRGYIIRTDLKLDELDYLYNNMPEDELFAALGLPLLTRETRDKFYIYLIEDATLEVHFGADNKLYRASLFGGNSNGSMQLPENSEKAIDKHLHSLPLKENISEADITFIDKTTTVSVLQEKLGAPHGMKPFTEPSGPVLNSYYYKLSNGNLLLFVYEPEGLVLRAWIEDSKGEETKVLVEFYEIKTSI